MIIYREQRALHLQRVQRTHKAVYDAAHGGGRLALHLLCIHPTPSTLRPALCTLHPPPCTLHPPPSALHPHARRVESAAGQPSLTARFADITYGGTAAES